MFWSSLIFKPHIVQRYAVSNLKSCLPYCDTMRPPAALRDFHILFKQYDFISKDFSPGLETIWNLFCSNALV